MNKYREGKMKRTLKRESKEREIVIGEAFGGVSNVCSSLYRYHTEWFQSAHICGLFVTNKCG